MTTVENQNIEQWQEVWKKEVELIAAGYLGITGQTMTEAYFGGYRWEFDKEEGWKAMEKDNKRNRNRRG